VLPTANHFGTMPMSAKCPGGTGIPRGATQGGVSLSTGSVTGPGPAREEPQARTHDDHEQRHCFYCLEGFVFLGSLDHDGQETHEAIRCRRCNGTGVLTGGGEAIE